MNISIKTNAGITAAFILALTVISFFQFPHLRFDSDLLALFPKDQQRPAVSQASGLMSGWLSNKLILLVSSNNSDSTVQLSREVETAFSSSSAVSSVVFERDASRVYPMLELYRQHASSLIPHKELESLSDAPERFVQAQIRRVYQSPGAINSDTFLQDPFDFATRFMAQASPTSGNLFLKEGYFAAEFEGRLYVMLEVSLLESAYSVKVQGEIVGLLDSMRARLKQMDGDAQLLANGPVLFAAAGSHQAKKEISTVGTGSLVGVLLLLLLVFRSAPIMLLSMLPTAVGIVMGILAVKFLFGPVHVIAMVFGASLVGVSIDYTLHFFVTRLAMSAAAHDSSTSDSSKQVSEGWRAEVGVRRLFNGLTLGLVTSSLAYLSFAFSGFPGFQQIAVFSAAGLVGAYLIVMGFYPFLFSSSQNIHGRIYVFEAARKIIDAYWVLKQKRKRKLIAVAGVLSGILILVAAANFETTDDIRKMQQLDAELVSESKHFDEILGVPHAFQFMLAKADSPEQLLERLEGLSSTLASAAYSVSDLSHWIPSLKKQKFTSAAFNQSLLQSGLMTRYLEALHIQQKKQGEIADYVIGQNEKLLEFEEAYALLEKMMPQPVYFQRGQFHYGIITFSQIEDPDKLRQLAADTSWLEWVDQVEDTSRLLHTLRLKSSWLLLIAYALVFLLLSLRYRVRGALDVLMAPMLASLLTLAMLAALGYQINVFNIMGLLLVLGIGIDYSLFLRESKGSAHETWVAIAMSAITTLLAFGLLGLSKTFAIQSFGVSVLMGISLCVILAPLVVKKE